MTESALGQHADTGHQGQAAHEKNSAALTSVLAAIFLTGMKIVVGVMT